MKDDLLKIINHYGINNQLKQFNEESYELIEAIKNHEWLKEKGLEDINHVVEEIADVLVMVSQFVEYYQIEEEMLDWYMNYKVKRQLDRMKK